MKLSDRISHLAWQLAESYPTYRHECTKIRRKEQKLKRKCGYNPATKQGQIIKKYFADVQNLRQLVVQVQAMEMQFDGKPSRAKLIV